LSPDFCGLCGTPLLSQQFREQQAAATLSEGIPWESVSSLGVGRALLRTLQECLFTPFAFFRKFALPHSPAMSFVYALILGSVGSTIGFLWTWLFLSRFQTSFPWLESISSASMSATSLVFMPLLTSIKIGFATVYFQTLLTLTGSKRKGISSTFSIVCYSESTALLNLIPLVGGIVALAWSLFLLSAGISRVHTMSTVKALVIIFLPLLIAGFIGILAVALLAGVSAVLGGGL
jgi:hypothetical protein